MKTSKGMTLVELMVALAVFAILAAVALPSLATLQSAIRANAKISEIASAIQLARNHAVSYGVRVSVCPVTNNCCSNDWQAGFSVFTDTGSTGCLDGDDELITELDEISHTDILKFSRSSLRFLPDGLASGYNGTFRYCPDAADSPNSKALIISNAGRIRLSKGSSNCK